MRSPGRRPRSRISSHGKPAKKKRRTKSQKMVGSIIGGFHGYISDRERRIITNHAKIPGYVDLRLLSGSAQNYITGSVFRSLNEKLRNGQRSKLSKTEKKTFQSLSQSIRRIPSSIKVFRGVEEKCDIESGFINLRSFTSFSSSFDHIVGNHAFSGDHFIIEMELPKGTRALITNAEEGEIILPPNKYKIKVKSIRRKLITYSFYGERYTEIFCSRYIIGELKIA